MAIQTIQYFKNKFITGYKPTQIDYADLFDTFGAGTDLQFTLNRSALQTKISTGQLDEGAQYRITGRESDIDICVWATAVNAITAFAVRMAAGQVAAGAGIYTIGDDNFIEFGMASPVATQSLTISYDAFVSLLSAATVQVGIQYIITDGRQGGGAVVVDGLGGSDFTNAYSVYDKSYGSWDIDTKAFNSYLSYASSKLIESDIQGAITTRDFGQLNPGDIWQLSDGQYQRLTILALSTNTFGAIGQTVTQAGIYDLDSDTLTPFGNGGGGGNYINAEGSTMIGNVTINGDGGGGFSVDSDGSNLSINSENASIGHGDNRLDITQSTYYSPGRSLVYGDDYSPYYSDRSLVDKGYVVNTSSIRIPTLINLEVDGDYQVLLSDQFVINTTDANNTYDVIMPASSDLPDGWTVILKNLSGNNGFNVVTDTCFDSIGNSTISQSPNNSANSTIQYIYSQSANKFFVLPFGYV